jgi:hypothetical protein
MVLHIQRCVKRALKEDAAGIFNKPSRQPSLIRALQVVAAETSHQRHHGVGGVRRLAVEINPRIEMQRSPRFLQNGKGQSGWRARQHRDQISGTAPRGSRPLTNAAGLNAPSLFFNIV